MSMMMKITNNTTYNGKMVRCCAHSNGFGIRKYETLRSSERAFGHFMCLCVCVRSKVHAQSNEGHFRFGDHDCNHLRNTDRASHVRLLGDLGYNASAAC